MPFPILIQCIKPTKAHADIYFLNLISYKTIAFLNNSIFLNSKTKNNLFIKLLGKSFNNINKIKFSTISLYYLTQNQVLTTNLWGQMNNV